MEIAELKEILSRMKDDGYGDWTLFMCDDDDDDGNDILNLDCYECD